MKAYWIGAMVCAILLVGCSKTSMEYVPIAAFEPSYKAMQGAQDDSYDIEETVRILNGLELAQAQSEDFDAFLEYMARQDYSKVAQEVVDLRMKLLPVLQEMYLIEQEYKEVNLWNSLARNLSADLSQQVVNPLTSSPTDSTVHGLISILGGASGLTPETILLSSVAKTGAKVFEMYQQTEQLKEELQMRMSGVKQLYIEYLEEYMPIYNKYMHEWNQLCLLKDRAYLQVYSGEHKAAQETCKEALEMHPNNREMLLLQSMAIIQASSNATENTNRSLPNIHEEIQATPPGSMNAELQVADDLLTEYIQLYPDYSAPALLLKGMIQYKAGNEAQAIVYLDQAAMEYPRQAEHLTDMLSSYRARTYLNNTAEGTYLLSLYQSTMEGFGLFSPNFAKAAIREQKGDLISAQEEIYNHFFRRSNQKVYDCLLLDMEYCEDHLAYSFKQLLPENSYLDVVFTRSAKIAGLGNDNNKLKVSLVNRSDKSFENVRIFLCIHYTDMYKTDYQIVRMPTLNRIKGLEDITLGEVELNYQGKSFNDITRVRAIALTDNNLCWIDNVYNKDIKTNYNPTRSATIAELAGSMNMKQRQRYFTSMNQTAESICEALEKNSSIEMTESGNLLIKHHQLHVRLPRIVAMINPTYELNENILPNEDYLQGSIAHLVFTDAEIEEQNQLTIKSVYASYRIHFSVNQASEYSINQVELLSE